MTVNAITHIDLDRQVSEIRDEQDNVVAYEMPASLFESIQEVIPLAQRALYGHRVRPQLRRALNTLQEVAND